MKNPNSKNEEYHIFEVKLVQILGRNKTYSFYRKPDPRYDCICKAMNCDEAEKIEKERLEEFYNEKDMRQKCAEIGRQVCGICVSSLYGTFNKDITH